MDGGRPIKCGARLYVVQHILAIDTVLRTLSGDHEILIRTESNAPVGGLLLDIIMYRTTVVLICIGPHVRVCRDSHCHGSIPIVPSHIANCVHLDISTA